MLPAEFTGKIVVEHWKGGVTRLDTKTSRTAPKAGEVKMRRDDRGGKDSPKGYLTHPR